MNSRRLMLTMELLLRGDEELGAAGQLLCIPPYTITHRGRRGRLLHCGLSPGLWGACSTSKERRITRWEHEHVLEAMQRRLDEHSEKMRQRRETVEHPFGTIKARMGTTHFLMKTLPLVATEMALHILAYNMRRVMSIMASDPCWQAAMRAEPPNIPPLLLQHRARPNVQSGPFPARKFRDCRNPKLPLPPSKRFDTTKTQRGRLPANCERLFSGRLPPFGVTPILSQHPKTAE
jgi:Transposase DDE domain